MFIAMQLVGGAVAVAVVHVIYPTVSAVAGDVVVPHPQHGPSAEPA